MEKISMKQGENLTIKEGLEQYIRWCKLKNYSEDTIEFYTRTIHCYLRGLKTIITHLMRKGIVPQFEIIVPKGDEAIKDVYTEEELERLLKKPDVKRCRFEDYRNWVIVNYLLGTGQRRRTVVNLKIGDLDLGNKLVKVRVRNMSLKPDSKMYFFS